MSQQSAELPSILPASVLGSRLLVSNCVDNLSDLTDLISHGQASSECLWNLVKQLNEIDKKLQQYTNEVCSFFQNHMDIHWSVKNMHRAAQLNYKENKIFLAEGKLVALDAIQQKNVNIGASIEISRIASKRILRCLAKLNLLSKDLEEMTSFLYMETRTR